MEKLIEYNNLINSKYDALQEPTRFLTFMIPLGILVFTLGTMAFLPIGIAAVSRISYLKK